jgi:two-component system, chemotaxis family, sensor kinase CheA
VSENNEDLLGGYQEESVEHLALLEEKLLLLEKGEASKDDINSAFRSIHTVKGGSGFFGLKTIGSMAHVMEDLLGQYRAGTQPVSAAGCDALLEGYEKLRACFEDFSYSEEVDITKPLTAIKKILTGDSGPEETKTPAKSSQSATKPSHPFTAIPLTVLPGYWIQFQLDQHSAAEIVENIASVGEVLETFPKDLATAKDVLDVLYTTVLEMGLLEDVIPKAVFIHPFESLQGSPTQVDDSEPSKTAPPEATDTAHEEASASMDESPKKDESASNKKKTKNNISIRVDFDQLSKLINLSGELILSRNQFINKLAGAQLDDFFSMSKQISELQEGLMKTRMQRLSTVTSGFPRLVRNLAKQLDKKVELKVIGEDIELDRNILEGISGPFTHILRNSLDHGIESPEGRQKAGKPQAGKITVHAYQRMGGFVTIEVKDDGKGIDPEKIKSIAVKKGVLKQSEADLLTKKQAIALIYAPGFSTAETVTAVSGRGVGMDVVKTEFEKLGGTVDLDSVFGQGTTLTIQLPLSVAIIQSIIVGVAGELYAIPRNNINEVVVLDSFEERKALEQLNGSEMLRHRKMLLPVVNMGTVLGSKKVVQTGEVAIDDQRENVADRRTPDRRDPSLERRKDQKITIIIMNIGEDQYGIVVDKVSHQEETVVKNLNQILSDLNHYMGVTILSSGKVCFILDNLGFTKHANISFKQKSFATVTEGDRGANSSQIESAEDYLLFEVAPGERVAILAGLVQKAVIGNLSEVMVSKKQKFITNNGIDYKLLFLHEALELTPFDIGQEFYYVIPKYSSIPYAFVASKICGIHTVPNHLELVGGAEKGKVGTVVFKTKLLTVLDLYALEELFFSGQLVRNFTKLGGVKRVLVVEDALVFRKIIKGYLEEMGVRCDMAKHGKEALGLLESSNYDLVISDIEMPIMDGYELIQIIRGKEDLKNLPVIALTSLVSEENRTKGLNLGFSDYLVKTDKKAFIAGIAKILLGTDAHLPALAEMT